MPELSNTATLPSGQRTDKNRELTPEPAALKATAHVITVKPESKVVLVHDRAGRVVARYFDEDFAREEIGAAGLDFDKLRAHAVLKEEQAARNAARRILNRPDRRLRSERKKERAERAEKAEEGKTGKREDGS